MAAILQTAGPASTYQAINSNWKHLNINSHHFEEAATHLQEMGFGTYVTTRNYFTRGSPPIRVFIKKDPIDVQTALAANLDLCTPEIYQDRFYRRPTKVISRNVRAFLVSKGLVSKNILTK